MPGKYRDFTFANSIINRVNCEVLHQGFAHITPDEWRFDDVTAPFNRLYILQKGVCRIYNGKESVDLKPGYAYLIPRNNTYSYRCVTPVDKLFIHFTMGLFAGNDIFDAFRSIASIPVGSIVRTIMPWGTGKNAGAVIRYRAALLDILGRFLTPHGDAIAHRVQFAHRYGVLLAYIDDNYVHGISLKKIAVRMNISVANLCTRFKHDTGQTVKEYINARIIQKAKELILTDEKIKDAARKLSFQDEYYFSRFFKKHAGMSPNEYRKKNMMSYT